MQEKSGKLPNSHRWFLMSQAFGLLPVEIARMEGMKSSTAVQKAIRYISDKIMAGEITLFNPTDKEKAEAKARLEGARRRNRESRNRNIEKHREKDRDRYARKTTQSQSINL